MMRRKISKLIIPAVLVILVGIATSGFTAPITPLAKKKMIEDGTYEKAINQLMNSGMYYIDKPDYTSNVAKLSLDDTVDTLTLLVLLVDFADNPESGDNISGSTPADFETQLFSTGFQNPNGSMTEFYLENSYGKMFIKGEVHGWYRMPNSYDYYVAGNAGTGIWPYNSQGLAFDAAYAAYDDGVDFTKFDTYGDDGEIDGLLIVHAGPGMERTGDMNDMISHMSTLGNDHQIYVDGILVNSYTIQPEEYILPNILSPIGVFCHEFGHVLGLPDLYDVDYSPETSSGVGAWSLMATGSYNNNGSTPAHFDAWCKTFLGFVSPVLVTSNMTDVEIPQAESEPVVYKLWKDGIPGLEYFLVENRQKVGFDDYLPGNGLMIYHVDDGTTFNNEDVLDYHVAVEQADGSFDLEWSDGNDGDTGDPWPGSTNKRSFDDRSEPSSRGYGNYITEVSVWDISDSDSLMTANMDIEWSRPYFSLYSYLFDDANGNGVIEAGENVDFYFFIDNYWLTATNATITLTTNDEDIVFGTQTIDKTYITGDGARTDNYGEPITFTVPDSLVPIYDSFFVVIESDDGAFTAEFPIEKQVGKSQILIVDDDRGGSYEDLYVDDLYQKLIPADVWTKQTSGTPSAAFLSNFNIVIWFTGDTSAEKLSTNDVLAMKSYLDDGGNLFLTGQMIASELDTQDPDFLSNYLHASYEEALFGLYQTGQVLSPIASGLTIRYNPTTNQDYNKAEKIGVNEDAIPAFNYMGFADSYTSLSFQGNYKLVFFNFGYEAISSKFSATAKRDTVLTNILNFFGRMTTEVADEYVNMVMPENFLLEQNYPNPFNPITKIRYTIRNDVGQSTERTVLKVFNILGREVRTLVDEPQRTGTYEIEWDATDNSGQKVSSGIYFYRLYRGDISASKKMILLK